MRTENMAKIAVNAAKSPKFQIYEINVAENDRSSTFRNLFTDHVCSL